MMIQNSNPLSLLLGLEGGSAGQPASGAGAGFAESLLQQLAALQGNLTANAGSATGADILAQLQGKAGNVTGADILAQLQGSAGALDGRLAGQDVRNVAALFGNTLPAAKKADADTNLDDTLSALAEVLAQLQGGETAAADTSASLPVTGSDAHAANGEHADAKQQEDLAAAVAAASQAQVAVPVAGQATDQGAGEAPVEASNDSAPEELLSSNKDRRTGNFTAANREVFAAGQSAGDKQSLLPGAVGTLLNADSGNGQPGADKHSASQDGNSGLSFLTDAVDAKESSKTSDTNKAPFRIANDIAQLDQTVRSDKTVEAPAMNRSFNHPGWNQELGEKLIWMHKQDIPSAELRLNPQHLGPISIKVDVNQDQTNVSFSTPHAAVKEAIEAAIPKLREMLGGQQLNLVDVNVSQQQSQQRQPSGFFQASGEQGRGNHAEQDESSVGAISSAADINEEIEAGRAMASNGLLSLFA